MHPWMPKLSVVQNGPKTTPQKCRRTPDLRGQLWKFQLCHGWISSQNHSGNASSSVNMIFHLMGFMEKSWDQMVWDDLSDHPLCCETPPSHLEVTNTTQSGWFFRILGWRRLGCRYHTWISGVFLVSIHLEQTYQTKFCSKMLFGTWTNGRKVDGQPVLTGDAASFKLEL